MPLVSRIPMNVSVNASRYTYQRGLLQVLQLSGPVLGHHVLESIPGGINALSLWIMPTLKQSDSTLKIECDDIGKEIGGILSNSFPKLETLDLNRDTHIY